MFLKYWYLWFYLFLALILSLVEHAHQVVIELKNETLLDACVDSNSVSTVWIQRIYAPGDICASLPFLEPTLALTDADVATALDIK